MSDEYLGYLEIVECEPEELPPPSPTPMMFDRRSLERRELGLVPEPIERRAARRGEERRSSPRVARRLWVVDPIEGGVPKVYEGEIGLGGASWLSGWPPMADQFEVRFRLPDHDEEVKAAAKLSRVADVNGDTKVQVMFTDLPLRHELAIARYLDDCVIAG